MIKPRTPVANATQPGAVGKWPAISHCVRRLSIDPGMRRVGLAWCDGDTSIALPLSTLDGRDPKRLVVELCAEIERLQIAEVIVGLPLMMDGSEGDGALRSRRLAAALERQAKVAVVLWDERLTTVGAQRALRSAGIEARKQKDKIDQAAATILLQSYLDSRNEAAWDDQAADEPAAGEQAARDDADASDR